MSSPRNIRLLLAYDGTDFNGWQIQKKGRTVQGVIEEALTRIHKHSTGIIGAGRTDSGVHARGQVANFYSTIPSIPASKYADALNSLLPGDVRVLGSEEAGEKFHSRYDAVERTYRYHILLSREVLPWQRNYCLHLMREINLKILMQMADCLKGAHDFTAFSATDVDRKSSTRHIKESLFYIDGDYLVYHIKGNAFLWKMVRTIIGTLLELERDGGGPEEVMKILASKDRDAAGATAPPRGLFLHRIEYGNADGK